MLYSYNMIVNTISVKDARSNFAEVLEKVSTGKERYIISKFGKAKAMLVPMSDDVLTTRETILKQRRKALNDAKGMWKDNDLTLNLRKKSSTRYGKIFN